MNIPNLIRFSHGGAIKSILEAAVEAVDPRISVIRNLKVAHDAITVPDFHKKLSEIGHIYTIGIGKASIPMARGVHEQLGDLVTGGYLICKSIDWKSARELPDTYTIQQGSHPIPSQESVEAGKGLIQFVSNAERQDFYVCLISGGGSALCTLPYEEIELKAMQSVTDALLKCGASIQEINTVRKHIDVIKGGGLLQYISPAQSVTLVLSDVIGDELSMIASGPTVADPTTYNDAYEILENYNIIAEVPLEVIDFLKKGMQGVYSETLKPDSKILKNNHNQIIGSIKSAVNAAVKKAHVEGFDTKVITTEMTGEAREKGIYLGEMLKNTALGKSDARKPVCLIAGGETTVTIQGNGKGGRNQELALAAAMELDGIANCTMITFATDGEDGPTDAAGAVITGDTVQLGREMGMQAEDYLNNNDSYCFFNRMDALLKPGPTGTNVNDLVLMFAF